MKSSGDIFPLRKLKTGNYIFDSRQFVRGFMRYEYKTVWVKWLGNDEYARKIAFEINHHAMEGWEYVDSISCIGGGGTQGAVLVLRRVKDERQEFSMTRC